MSAISIWYRLHRDPKTSIIMNILLLFFANNSAKNQPIFIIIIGIQHPEELDIAKF